MRKVVIEYTERELELAEELFAKQLVYESLGDMARDAGISLETARSIREGKWIHGRDIVRLILWRERWLKHGMSPKHITFEQAVNALLAYIRAETSREGRLRRLDQVRAKLEVGGMSLVRAVRRPRKLRLERQE